MMATAGWSTIRGMALMLASTVAFAVMNGFVRTVSATIHPFEIAFFRCVFAFVVFLPILWSHGSAILKPRRIGLYLLCGALSAFDSFLFFLAVSISPLAKVTALDFSSPLFAAVLAPIVLGETLGWKRAVALGLGCIGALIIIRPGLDVFDLGSILVLFAAAGWGLTMILMKIAARTDHSLTITVVIGVVSSPLSLLGAIPVWQTPTLGEFGLLVLIGSLAGFGMICVAQAFREADITAVLPFDFMKLVWASAIGYVFFAETPHLLTWVGGVVIFAAAAYVTIEERRAGGEASAPSRPDASP